jgi:putative flippase GtrA
VRLGEAALKAFRRDGILRLVRFGVVGVSCTLLYLGLSLGLVQAGLGLLVSHCAAYLVSLVASYLGHKLLTFQVRGQHGRTGSRFVLVTIVIAGTQFALVALLGETGLTDELVLLVSTVYYPLASFAAHSLYTFRAADR